MSHARLTGWQKATALLPLALLSGAWTTSLATTATADPGDGPSRLPDGSTVPNRALEAPASLTQPGSIAPGVPDGSEAAVVAGSSADGIPAAALAAYQRAAQVVNQADRSCHVPWQLIAAIGRVESNHGRYGGNVLGDDGKSRPGIYGIPLDGKGGTAQISDTDSGDLDDDAVHDRAVGPMQFIPETWRVVGVDGDGDGERDPQDIDDAALASAVYLCSGDEDLSTYGGQKASVYRYNHSEEYVDLVIAIMNAYLDGDFSSTPNGVAASPVFASSEYDDMPGWVGGTKRPGQKPSRTQVRNDRPHSGSASGGTGVTSPKDSGSDSPDAPPPSDPTPDSEPAKKGTDAVRKTVKDTVDNTGKAVEDSLSALDKAKQTCRANFTAKEIQALGGLTDCANAVLDKGVGGVTETLGNLLGGTVGGVTDGLGLN